MDKKPSTRQEILVLLKKSGGLTVDGLAQALQITSMGVRQHLAGLESDGLVETSQVRHKVGRPSYLYRLSNTAESSFPKDYINLVAFLLAELEKSHGPERVHDLFRRYAARMKSYWKSKVAGHPLPTRVRLVKDLLADDGNMPELGQTATGEYVLTIYNCRLATLTKGNPSFCLHNQILAEVLEAQVTQDESISTGGNLCRYVISP